MGTGGKRRNFTGIIFFIVINDVIGWAASSSSPASASLADVPGGLVGPAFATSFQSSVVYANTQGVLIPCQAHGLPDPVVSWVWAVKNSELMTSFTTDNAVLPTSGLVEPLSNGSLHFKPFHESLYDEELHSNLRVRCRASNVVGTVIGREIHVKAVLASRYQTFTVRVNDVYVTHGNTAVVQCTIDPYYVRDYVTVVTWTQNGVSFQTGGRFSVMTNGDLHIRDVTVEDGFRSLRCTTINVLTGERRTSGPSTLYVIEPVNSPPIMKDSPTFISVRRGDRLELPCVASGYPLPVYIWSRDGHVIITPSNETGLKRLGSNLVVTSAAMEDSGEYICTAENSQGSRSMSVRLEVKDEISLNANPSIQTIDIGEDAILECLVTGTPMSSLSDLVWYKNGWPVVLSSRVSAQRSESDGGRLMLRVSAVERKDAGMYQCLASSDADNAEAASRLVIGAAKPHIYRRFEVETFAQTGASISLSCVAAGNPFPAITWSLDGAAIDLESRYVISHDVTSDGDAISYMNVTRIEVSDGGKYTCTATNSVASDDHQGTLRVYGVPYVRPLNNVTAVAGRNTLIHCYVTGYPLHSITWSKGVSVLPANHRQQVHPNGTLVIDDVDRHADEGWYSCDARDVTGQGMNQNVFVTVLESPVIDRFSFPRRKQFDRVSVSCVVSQGDLPIEITWYKDGAPLPGQLGIIIQKTGEYSSLLSVSSVDQRHNGNFTCVASNAASSVHYTALLRVDVPPSWQLEPQNSEVVLDQRVVIECQAAGDPVPIITWKKDYSDDPQKQRGNYRPLLTNDERVRQSRDGSLSIDGALISDGGYYLCQAGNGVGSDLSKVVHLVVHIPAKVRDSAVNYTVFFGETIDLECMAEGDLPLSVAWSQAIAESVDRMKQSNFEPASRQPGGSTSSMSSLSGMRGSRLTISNSRRGDTGFYVCTCQNAYGSDTSTVQLVVLEVPDAPVDVQLTDVTSRTLTLSWDVLFDGNSPLTSIIIEIFDDSETADRVSPIAAKSLRVDGSADSFTIDGLWPAVTYWMRLRAENLHGLGNFSTTLRATTLDEEPSAGPVNVSATATGSQTIKIHWKPPPVRFHNGRLLGYYIGYKKYNSSAPYRYIGKSVPIETCELAELDKFTLYSIYVQAYNVMGPGPRSDDVIVMTLEDVPSQPPTDVTARALTSQSLYVVWSPPPITTINGVLQGYQILYRSVRYDEDESDDMSVTTTVRSATLLGLRKFTNYSVQVLALTRIGQGVASRPFFVNTLSDLPDMPADVKAVAAGPTSVMLAWRPPLHSNGILTKYTLQIHDLTTHAQAPQETVREFSVALVNSYHVTNLSGNYRYGFRVAANTDVGQGEFTRQVTASTVDRVSAKIVSFPLKISSRDENSVLLPCIAVGLPQPSISWKQGVTDVLLSDRVQLLRNGSLVINDVTSSDAGEYTCRAENEDGVDEIAVSLVKQAAPHAPILSATMTTSSTVQVMWRTGSNGGSPIQGFSLYVRREHDSDPIWRRFGATNRSFVASNLRCGSRYTFVLRAFNRIGEGRSSNTVDAKTNGSAPIMPPQSMLLYDVNVTSATFAMDTWETGGCPIKYFDVDLQVMGDNVWKSVQRNISPNVTTYNIVDLHPSTWYIVRLTAHNDAGSTECLLRFATKSYVGSDLIPLPPGQWEDSSSTILDTSQSVFMRPEVAVPVCACVVVMLVACVAFAICRRRSVALKRLKRRQVNASKFTQDHQPTIAFIRGTDSFKVHEASCNTLPYTADESRRLPARDINFHPLLSAPPRGGCDDIIAANSEMTSQSDNEREESFSDSDPYISRHRRKHAPNNDDIADSGVDDVIYIDRAPRISQRQNIGQRSRTSLRFKEGTSSSLSSGTDEESHVHSYATMPQHCCAAMPFSNNRRRPLTDFAACRDRDVTSPSSLPQPISGQFPATRHDVDTGFVTRACRHPSDEAGSLCSASSAVGRKSKEGTPLLPVRRTPSLGVGTNLPALTLPVDFKSLENAYPSLRTSKSSTFNGVLRHEPTSSLHSRSSVAPPSVSSISRQQSTPVEGETVIV